MKIVVTGAAGGIGSILCDELVRLGHVVWAVDDLSSGSWSNITARDADSIYLVTASILDSSLADALPWTEVDSVVHLAAISSLPDCQSDPATAFERNLVGTIRITDLAKRSPSLRSFINASTSAVYEGIAAQPFTEQLEVAPHLVYSQSKLAAESYVSSLRGDMGFPGISLRFFNVFGPMQDYRRKSPPLLNYLVREIVNGRTPVLHSNGLQARDYISVVDVVRALVICLDHEFREADIFNICSGTQLSVRDFVELCEEAFDRLLEPSYRASDLLWSSYENLFSGQFPLKREVVAAETEKDSLGSHALFTRETGWLPSPDTRADVISTIRAAAAHIKREAPPHSH